VCEEEIKMLFPKPRCYYNNGKSCSINGVYHPQIESAKFVVFDET
jgi:hypothetical protein